MVETLYITKWRREFCDHVYGTNSTGLETESSKVLPGKKQLSSMRIRRLRTRNLVNGRTGCHCHYTRQVLKKVTMLPSCCLRKVDPPHILDLFESQRISLLCGAPTVINMLVNEPKAKETTIMRSPRMARAGTPQKANV